MKPINTSINTAKQIAQRALLLTGLWLSNTALAAPDVLRDLQTRYQAAQFIAADFHQEKQVKFISQPLLSTGRFAYGKQAGLLWQVDSPYAAQFLLTGQGLWRYATDRQQWLAETGEANQAMLTLVETLLAGRWETLQSLFTVQQAQTATDGRWTLTLTSEESRLKRALKQLTLSGAADIENLTFTAVNGDTTTLTLTQTVYQTEPLSNAQRQRFAR